MISFPFRCKWAFAASVARRVRFGRLVSCQAVGLVLTLTLVSCSQATPNRAIEEKALAAVRAAQAWLEATLSTDDAVVFDFQGEEIDHLIAQLFQNGQPRQYWSPDQAQRRIEEGTAPILDEMNVETEPPPVILEQSAKLFFSTQEARFIVTRPVENGKAIGEGAGLKEPAELGYLLPAMAPSAPGERRLSLDDWPTASVLLERVYASDFCEIWEARREDRRQHETATGAPEWHGEKPGLGRWDEVPANAPVPGQDHGLDIEALDAIGYLGTTTSLPRAESVTIYDADRAWNGYNLIISGHGFECVLVDMNGQTAHRWAYDYWKLFPDRPLRYNNMWFMAHVFPNGDLLVLQDGYGVFKLDKDSELLWEYPSNAHHDFAVAPDGDIYLLHSKSRLIPRCSTEQPIRDDFVVILDQDGIMKRRISLLAALERAEDPALMETVLAGLAEHKGDIFHTNTVEVLDGSLAAQVPAFKAGNLLLSCRSPSLLMVLDTEERRIDWTMQGAFRYQHSPEVVDGKHILLFDNDGEKPQSVVRELDPLTGETVWAYRGNEAHPFYARVNSRSHRLPNGNTLIVESTTGRAFEVTHDGAIVWEYWNPHRSGEDERYIARIFEVVRLSADFPLDWAENR